MIRGIIFDFDGLIVDTEWSVYQSWVQIFEEFNAKLPLDQWTSIIGTSEYEHFDPYDVLEQQAGHKVNRESLRQQRRDHEMKLVAAQPILPGVEEYLRIAKAKNLKLAIASSSDRKWVAGNLRRLGLLDYFEIIHTSDDVERTKPNPALYLLALQSLGLNPEETIVLEDSPNGVDAAKAAGIFTVAVPNPLTARLDLGHADLILNSLADLALPQLIEKAENSTDSSTI
jgi:HAD superfamily hydrolase (TIGR01509 family)